MQNLSVTLVAMVALSSASCGKADFSQAQAAQAFDLTSHIMTQAFSAAQQTATSVPSSPSLFTLSRVYSCKSSGIVNVSGTLNVNGSTWVSDSQFAFNACAEQGTTIQGQTSMKFQYNDSATQNIHYLGDISYDGDLSGNCHWDITYTVDKANIAYSGTVCGFELSGAQSG